MLRACTATVLVVLTGIVSPADGSAQALRVLSVARLTGLPFEYEYEAGTGTKVRTDGPNDQSCATGCSNGYLQYWKSFGCGSFATAKT